jgi:hypothetical protein
MRHFSVPNIAMMNVLPPGRYTAKIAAPYFMHLPVFQELVLRGSGNGIGYAISKPGLSLISISS